MTAIGGSQSSSGRPRFGEDYEVEVTKLLSGSGEKMKQHKGSGAAMERAGKAPAAFKPSQRLVRMAGKTQ